MYSVLKPNYLVFDARKLFFKNLKRKINLLERRDCLEEDEDGTIEKHSKLFRTSVIKRFNENSISFSINNSHYKGVVKDLFSDEISFINEIAYNSSFSLINSFMKKNSDLINKKENTQKRHLLKKNIFSNKEIKLRYSSQNVENSAKPSLIPVSCKKRILMKNIINTKTKKSLKSNHKEKSITPLIRNPKIPLNTPVNCKPIGFMTSRNENTPSKLLRQNLANEKSLKPVSKMTDKNCNFKPQLKVNLDRNHNLMIKNTISIKKMISDIVSNKSVMKKPPSISKHMVENNIKTNKKLNIDKPSSFNYHSIKSPSVFNINLNLNLNLNLNMNSSYKAFSHRFSKIPSEGIININTKKTVSKNHDDTRPFKLNSLNSKRSDRELKMTLTDRNSSKRQSVNKKLSINSQPKEKHSTEIKGRYKNNNDKAVCKHFEMPKNNKYEINKIPFKKTNPILKIDLNKYSTLEPKQPEISKKSSKECITDNKSKLNFKGIKINNFEKIYELKNTPKKPPNSTNRNSKDKVKKLLYK